MNNKYCIKRTILVIVLFWYKFSYAACVGLGCSCSVSALPVVFGSYNPISSTNTDSTGTVNVTCSALVIFSTSYSIQLGTGGSGNFSSRSMLGLSGMNLNYNLYTTSARITIWGDGTASTSTISDSYTALLLSETRGYTVYGRIPAAQVVNASSYTDSVVVTVVY